MKSLPLGIHTFKDIIRNNGLYVDKTENIYNLIKDPNQKFFFLSRPRRFGKSLLTTTLQEIFLGKKELFKDLYIYDKLKWESYPTIRIDFSAMDLSSPDILISSIKLFLQMTAKDYRVKLDSQLSYKQMFQVLLKELSKQGQVILLIDEYDKPIIEFIDDIKISNDMKLILKNFYSTIKASDEYIKFCFITGISKFSKISIFSDLNNLRDITLSPDFSNICGYTQDELYEYFDKHITILSNKLEIDVQTCKNKIKKWYNGYSWDNENYVYNPFSILYLFTDNDIKNYWFESGSPSLLLKFIKKYHVDIQNIENIKLEQEEFSSYEVDNMNMNALLFQTGYLTIKNISKNPYSDLKEYLLSYPNEEVRESFNKSILNNITNNKLIGTFYPYKLIEYLMENKLDDFFKHIITIFDTIPYNIIPNESNSTFEKEYYYHTIFYLILKIIGVNIQCEVSNSKGRIDAVIQTNTHIYIFEFKVGRSPKKALQQIKDKSYYNSFLDSGKKIINIGVSFSIAKKNINKYEIKEYLLD